MFDHVADSAGGALPGGVAALGYIPAVLRPSLQGNTQTGTQVTFYTPSNLKPGDRLWFVFSCTSNNAVINQNIASGFRKIFESLSPYTQVILEKTLAQSDIDALTQAGNMVNYPVQSVSGGWQTFCFVVPSDVESIGLGQGKIIYTPSNGPTTIPTSPFDCDLALIGFQTSTYYTYSNIETGDNGVYASYAPSNVVLLEETFTRGFGFFRIPRLNKDANQLRITAANAQSPTIALIAFRMNGGFIK